jgi:hypothetical protein
VRFIYFYLPLVHRFILALRAGFCAWILPCDLLYIFHHVSITVTCFYYAPSLGYNRRMLWRVVVTIVFYFIIVSHRNGSP